MGAGASVQVQIDFASPVSVTAGSKYAIWVDAAATMDMSNTWGIRFDNWGAIPRVGYAGGKLWQVSGATWNQLSESMWFRVLKITSDPVDDPADSAPVAPIQQFGLPQDASCDEAASPELNWAGVRAGGWAESWAEWMNDRRGGSVCTRTLVFDPPRGQWSVQ